ncbi:aminotransferase class III-fold pyridoxal phosphate-dependent enzyme [Sphingomonas sp.]|uniref:aminotransferase class III-fold pyridoxal phosphate-dependent enzyme n=1 Tax=Sphingomonas sp. TaxID=28214 RepID=UPI002DE2DEF7|nr:aminotransferase class III-fold pyridoxal phosphate-dependent enzyme [Sphingomonas sp.]HEV2567914.1 aminotransferase class III-fold pyridoxal phosphate-dependent enzyme [Sphingomonas sp.]
MLVSASGVHYRDSAGRSILDGASGLWCVNAGHSHPLIVEAVTEQLRTLDYAPCFEFGHPGAFEFAADLVGVMPRAFDRVIFANSGSEAVDTALKLSLAYHRARGEGGRTRLIGRERGYHGVGFGGTSVGGIGRNRAAFGTLLPGVDHLRHTYDPSAAFTRGQPEAGAELARDLQRLIDLHGAETIAAVIVEPVAGSTGVLVPPVGYLQLLREITERHGILLVFDEVITGYGRLGGMTASEVFGVTPDLIVLAKGLTNGTVPMGAVVVSAHVDEALSTGVAPGVELFHGYTCSGHPLAAAAGLATLRVFEEEGLCERAAALAHLLEEAVHELAREPFVRDVRNIGLAAAVELEPGAGAPGVRGFEVLKRCFEQGVLVRVTGDTIALAPALVYTEAHVEELVGAVRTAVRGIH